MRLKAVVLVVGLLACPAIGDMTFDVGPSTAPWNGYMNVFNLPEDGGAFQFGSGWGIPDLVASFDDPNSTVTLSPNTIGDSNEYWYKDPTGGGNTNPGGPGAPGNKIMEANLYIELSDDALAGTTVTFQGQVLSNTYTPAHEAFIFIRDFAPDYSTFNDTTIPATPGPFSISLLTDAGLGRHVQYGFQSVGVNVWVTDVAPFGSVTFGPIPEPATLALLGLGGLVLLRRRA